MLEKTIIEKPSLERLLEITRGHNKPIGMNLLRMEVGGPFSTRSKTFQHRWEYSPDDIVLQKAIIIANTAGEILVASGGRSLRGNKTIMVTGAGRKEFSEILEEKVDGCGDFYAGENDFFALTRDDVNGPVYAFESRLIITTQSDIKSNIDRTLNWELPPQTFRDERISTMERNMIRYLGDKEGLAV